MTTLAELLGSDAGSWGEQDILGLASDSRKAKPGDAFFALGGVKDDGLKHAAEALARGAVVVVGERAPAQADAPFVQVADARAALALACQRFYTEQSECIVAVTGTSGKTSVAAFAQQIFASLGREAASLGTIGVISRPIKIYGSLTTPDPIALHQMLQRLALAGVTHVAMEASSHGLDQKRLDGVRLKAGAFTNLSRDHLDYHPSMQAYLQAKLRLVRELVPPGAPFVIDADSEVAPQVIAATRACGRVPFTVGVKGETIRLTDSRRDGFATDLTLVYLGQSYRAALPLPGDFQVSNALVAAGLAIACGEDPARVFAALASLQGAPGRLERIGEVRGASVIVDYAHKPDALEKALLALRPFVSGKLVVIFGCGGDRDPGKRPIMGEIATRLADVAIVTDDNPRSENPASIRAAILAAAPGAREIGDRAEAIRAGVNMLKSGDALVIAGKGHETGQIVGDRTLPFSDANCARAAIEESA
jgi:UDP-N-acetylmuramoyl-L-alanyl-D-glutamate--2,6-diaminopimelate ligase